MRIGGSTLGIRRAVTVTKCPNKINPCATATSLESEPEPPIQGLAMGANESRIQPAVATLSRRGYGTAASSAVP
jgi:hypothetical protein